MNEPCGAKQPGRMAFCERTDDHVEHQATLSPRRGSRAGTYCYWTGDTYPVRYRVGDVTAKFRALLGRSRSTGTITVGPQP